VAVFEDTIYWSDFSLRDIQSCHKFTGNDHNIVVKSANHQTYGIQIIHELLEPAKYPPNKRCSHMSLLKKGGQDVVCRCPHGYILHNGHACIPPQMPEMRTLPPVTVANSTMTNLTSLPISLNSSLHKDLETTLNYTDLPPTHLNSSLHKDLKTALNYTDQASSPTHSNSSLHKFMTTVLNYTHQAQKAYDQEYSEQLRTNLAIGLSTAIIIVFFVIVLVCIYVSRRKRHQDPEGLRVWHQVFYRNLGANKAPSVEVKAERASVAARLTATLHKADRDDQCKLISED